MSARRRSSAFRGSSGALGGAGSTPVHGEIHDLTGTGGQLVDEVTAFLQSASLDLTPTSSGGGQPNGVVLLPYGRCVAADRALEAVVTLFGALPIRVRVLHLAEQRHAVLEPADGDNDEEAAAAVEAAIGKLRGHGITAVGVVRSGVRKALLPDLILDEARSSGAGVIVLGARRRNGLTSAVVGSTSRVVLREATCPVLMVRSP